MIADLIKKDKKDRKDYVNRQYYKQHKKSTVKPLTAEQKQEVQPGPLQKIICDCGKIFTRKNKSQHEKSMYHRQHLEDVRFDKQHEEKKQKESKRQL
jgi:hypothetical protein